MVLWRDNKKDPKSVHFTNLMGQQCLSQHVSPGDDWSSSHCHLRSAYVACLCNRDQLNSVIYKFIDGQTSSDWNSSRLWDCMLSASEIIVYTIILTIGLTLYPITCLSFLYHHRGKMEGVPTLVFEHEGSTDVAFFTTSLRLVRIWPCVCKISPIDTQAPSISGHFALFFGANVELELLPFYLYGTIQHFTNDNSENLVCFAC